MISYILLIADNNPGSVEIFRDTFTHMGWRVLTASNCSETRELLERKWIHLAIIDMRLTTDRDGDRSGLDIVQTVALHIPKIIWTYYPHPIDARDALTQLLGTRSKAVDYIDKKEEYDDIIRRIESTLLTYVPINKDMQLRAAGMHYMAERDVVRMLFNQIDHTSDILEQEEQIDELDDLIRLMFSTQRLFMFVRSLCARADFALIEAHLSPPEHEGRSYLLAYGNPQTIQHASIRYSNYALPFGMNIITQKRSTHFGMLTLSMPGQLDCLEPLRDYYHKAPIEHLRQVFTDICGTTLKRLCQSEIIQRSTHEVAHYYRSRLTVGNASVTEKDILQRIESICQEISSMGDASLTIHKHKLRLHTTQGVAQIYDWPTNILTIEPVCADSLSFCAIINGSIHVDTILVDAETLEAWLCDYSQVDHGPLLYDYALFETMLKFHLLGRMSLTERFQLEEQLDAMDSLNTTIVKEGLSSELQRALICIERIRSHAARLRPEVDLRSYQISLLYTTLRQILTFSTTNQLRYENTLAYAHCVLNYARIHQQLMQATKKRTTEEAWLRIDNELKELLIGEQHIKLTTSELAILQYLYARQGKVCTYEEICIHALGLKIEAPGDLKSCEPTYQPHVSRLRRKIKDAVGKNSYIKTVQGRGYMLVLE